MFDEERVKMEEDIEKIYVRAIDGTTFLIEINARELANNRFEILDDEEDYWSDDSGTLLEFYPGDIVEVENAVYPDDDLQWIAKEIVSRSSHPERLYLEFQFRATAQCLAKDKDTYPTYKDVIERIKKESAAGKFFYPMVLEEIAHFDRVKKLNESDEIF